MNIFLLPILALMLGISSAGEYSYDYEIPGRELKAVYRSSSSYRAPTYRTTTTKTTTTTAKKTYYSPSYTYSYSTYASPRVYTNNYWDAVSMRTYYPLYVYYLPPNYYNALGFYSPVYLMTYYDGYGYNFYYGGYGYYQYSVNPT